MILQDIYKPVARLTFCCITNSFFILLLQETKKSNNINALRNITQDPDMAFSYNQVINKVNQQSHQRMYINLLKINLPNIK